MTAKHTPARAKCGMGPCWCEDKFVGALSCESLRPCQRDGSVYVCADCGETLPVSEVRAAIAKATGKDCDHD